MMSARLWLPLVLAAPALGDPSPLIFPDQRLPLSFSHRQHLALHLKCDFCHESAPQSRLASDNLVPKEEACASCHHIDRSDPTKQARPLAACAGCHPGFAGAGEPPRVDIPAPNLRFNHQVHVARGVECVHCHAGIPEANLATRSELPRMPLCLECHDGRQAPERCTTCHLGEADGRIRTALPAGKLSPSGVLRGDAHDLRFRTDHKKVATNDPAYCANCHRQTECLSCHDGVVKPLSIHGNEYLTIHAADARRNQPDCGSCHRRQTFCLGCHQRTGVALGRDVLALSRSADPGYNAFYSADRRFHPKDWADPIRGPNHHSFQAQRNIAECASCHREETCLGCHATGEVSANLYNRPSSPVGGFIDPHPPGFAATERCRSLAARNPRVCLKCHARDDARLGCQPSP
jgi:cytochrome c7-like protein